MCVKIADYSCSVKTIFTNSLKRIALPTSNWQGSSPGGEQNNLKEIFRDEFSKVDELMLYMFDNGILIYQIELKEKDPNFEANNWILYQKNW